MVQEKLVYEGDDICARVHELEREVDRLLSSLDNEAVGSPRVVAVADELARLKELRGF